MNFALILFVLAVVTGLVAAADALWLQKRRGAGAPEPWWVEYPKSFFPVILAVFLLRSFLVEPFKIPSGSMVPTLEVGDFILVNKFTYGIRLPIVNKKIVEVGSPKRGDVMVFRYPEDPSVDYIKRVIGLPGDKVAVIDKHVFVNGAEYRQTPMPDYLNRDRIFYSKQFREKIGEVDHSILVEEDKPAAVPHLESYPFRGNCAYNDRGVTCTIPPGHYFMMGDNRDNSADSRVWGFVPDENIVGRAFFIWFNMSEPTRFGGFK